MNQRTGANLLHAVTVTDEQLNPKKTEKSSTPKSVQRVVIETVLPEIDGGRFPITRTPGELVAVSADIFADGHDVIDAALQYRRDGDGDWQFEPMQLVTNDRWEAQFRPRTSGIYFYTLRGWVDRFKSWARDLVKKADAGQDLTLDLMSGAQLLAATAKRASPADQEKLNGLRAQLKKIAGTDVSAAVAFSKDEDLIALMSLYRERTGDTLYGKELVVRVDRARARFSAWYEMFPRSCTTSAERPGTLRDCAEYIEYVAEMGFDVLYLPPIHPIGRAERKGKNNSTTPTPDDTGSPWAIGAKEGGHKAIHPQLGTLEDFKTLVRKARELGIDMALDIAFQCAPDHPYVKEHREWFRERPDGTVQYAENPPKKYQDIYPFNFETARSQELWAELKSVIRLLDRAGRSRLSSGQPSYQTVRVLGMGHRRGEEGASGNYFPLGGVHSTEGDVSVGETGIHAVVYLFCVEEHRLRADRIFRRR